MPKKLKLIDDSESVIKKALISQKTLAKALSITDVDFTRKLKKDRNAAFTIEEAKVMEKILNVKLTEPDTEQ